MPNSRIRVVPLPQTLRSNQGDMELSDGMVRVLSRTW